MSNAKAREYSLSDHQLVMSSSVVHSSYCENQTTFQEFDPLVYSDTFADDFQEAITEASNQLSDEFVLKEQKQETWEVKKITSDCVGALKVLSYYVDKAFPNDSLMRDRFNLSGIITRSRIVDKFVTYLFDVIAVVEMFSTELADEGYTSDKASELLVLVDELNDQRRQQKEMKIYRSKCTSERVISMNALWKRLVEINKVAEIVFEDIPEKKKLFELPRRIHSQREEIPEENVQVA